MRTGACTGLLGAILASTVLFGCSDSNSPPAPEKDGGGDGGNPQGSGGRGNGGTATGGGAGSGAQSSGGAGVGGAGKAGSGGGGPSSGGTQSAGGRASGGTQSAGGTPGSGGADAGAEDGGCGLCPSGYCLSKTICAECARDADCTSSAQLTRCSSATHTCVACLPGDGDNCGDGTYCDADQLKCVAGCKNNASCTAPHVCSSTHSCVDCDPVTNQPCAAGKYCTDTFTCAPGCGTFGQQCASGVCGTDHSCAHCTSDLECGSGKVCATGTCLPTCQIPTDCPTGLTCCGNHCAALDRDANHCGTCDGACGTKEFCGASNCHQAAVANVCDNPTVTLLKDGLVVDDAESEVIKDALANSCPSHPTGTVVDPAASGVVNPVTGAPITSGGNMIVSLGGPFGQKPLEYLEKAKVTPVYVVYDDPHAIYYGRAAVAGDPDPILVKDLFSTRGDAGIPPINADHDYFVIELAIEPASRTPYFAIYGFFAPGTAAASWYFINKVVPDPSQYPKSYYVIEWTDADGDHAPGAADTFTVRASG